VGTFGIGLGGDFISRFAFFLDVFHSFLVFIQVRSGGLSFIFQGKLPEKVPMSMEILTMKGNVLIIQGLKLVDVSISEENLAWKRFGDIEVL
jgi:hypothetical protein